MMSDGGIYIIGRPYDRYAKKIGSTVNFGVRLSQLRAKSRHHIGLMETWVLDDMDFARDVERTAHLMLHERRIKGDWFNVSLAKAGRTVDGAIHQVLEGAIKLPPLPSDWKAHSEAVAAGLRSAREAGRIGGAIQRRSDDEIWEAGTKLGMTAGATKLGYSLSGFIKAFDRVKRKRAPQDKGRRDAGRKR